MRHAVRFALALALFGNVGADCESAPELESCATDVDCDEGGRCSRNHCVYCAFDSDCDDGVFCNGRETCTRAGTCEAGEPIVCTPGEACPLAARACGACADPDVDGDAADSMACGGTDCDDTDQRRVPGGVEICDTNDLDEDCDPATFGIRDADGDGHIDTACCNLDGGNRVCGDDCDDTQGGVHPGLPESCDRRDNDCDTAVDEGVLVASYTDDDGDGWGVGRADDRCAGVLGYAIQNGDCDDGDPQIFPGAFRCAGSGAAIDLCGDNGRWAEDACPGGGMCVPQPYGTGICLAGVAPACSDGADNDDDGRVDWDDPNCASPLDDSEAAERCGDGEDNDGDGIADYPLDPGCASTEDATEGDPASAPACANGIDDDGDGTRDYAGGTGDPGCIAASDTDERQADGPACDNGIDDDSDLGIDCCAASGGDLECTGPADDSEAPPTCNNLLDDDGDGLTDFPADPGCTSKDDTSERDANAAACDNGRDDDMDGAADYPGDTGCSDAVDNAE